MYNKFYFILYLLGVLCVYSVFILGTLYLFYVFAMNLLWIWMHMIGAMNALFICECKVTTKIYYIYTRDSLHLSSTNFPIGAWYHWFCITMYTSGSMSQCIPVVLFCYCFCYCFWYLISSSTLLLQFYYSSVFILSLFCLSFV